MDTGGSMHELRVAVDGSDESHLAPGWSIAGGRAGRVPVGAVEALSSPRL